MCTNALLYYPGLVLLLCFTPVIQGQKRTLNASEIDQKFSQVWKTSEATKRKYSWKSKTEVTRDDKVTQVLIEQVSCQSNGKQIRKIISNQEAPLPSTFIIRQIAEDQKSKIVAFMGELRMFLEKYALDNDSLRHSFFSKASISNPDAKGQLLVSGSNVLTKGDKLKWWIDTRSYTITSATISTTFKGTGAEFSATYLQLPEMNSISQATILVPSKKMVVKLQFYDFRIR